MRVVHCVCCRTILAEAFVGPYLAICDDCTGHERDCYGPGEEPLPDDDRDDGRDDPAVVPAEFVGPARDLRVLS